MTVDDIAKVCSDFYREDEVFAAKAIIDQVLSSRLPKRQGNKDSGCTTDEEGQLDIVWMRGSPAPDAVPQMQITRACLPQQWLEVHRHVQTENVQQPSQ